MVQILGGQKIPPQIEKSEEIHVLNWWVFSFERWRLLLLLGRPSWRPRVKNATFEEEKIGLKLNDVGH